MTPMIKDFARCGCGRSESGFCDGSHTLTVEEYTQRLLSKTADYPVFPDEDSDSDHKSTAFSPT